MNISRVIAHELNVMESQILSTVELLDNGSTVPFIARYRKEVTGGLDDTQLRNIEERLSYLRDLEARREVILKSIAEQNKLTPELKEKILLVENKSVLEDIYLPYKSKRRTKAQIAKEVGLEPLALTLLNEPHHEPDKLAANFLNENVLTTKEALEGARYILMEHFSENADLLAQLRQLLWNQGCIKSQVIKQKEVEGNKFSDYFSYEEAIKKIPSHRMLAILRGQREGFLNVNLHLSDTDTVECISMIKNTFSIINVDQSATPWLSETVHWTWRIKLFLKLELELLLQLRENADQEAINVFASNLRNLLMSSPAGSRITMGLDPGLRTGVKVVVIDGTGKLLTYANIYPHAPKHQWDSSIETLRKLCHQFKVELISIGNGTASRETDKLVAELKKKNPSLNLTSIVISEAGASVYSASELAATEFPELDVTYRGAVSIARRLQDPLAELVKIDPKSIGVGQYQHDVNQIKLSKSLQSVMEDCVNAVGVNVNTASLSLLSCVAGLNASVAKNIISFRDQHGAFKNRIQLKQVPRLGEKCFEQAAGFLRIVNGDNPLDASAVHPESYIIVEKILQKARQSINAVMGNTSFLKAVNAAEFVDLQFGMPTITDILRELEKPGRDPRPEFKTVTFQEGIESIHDLKSGMTLEGVVTNVANFGAFVDIGVHQDGLVHTSMLANHFVKNPHEFIKVGDIVKVKVLDIDIPRKRIQLTMRLDPISKPKKVESGFGNLLQMAINKKI